MQDFSYAVLIYIQVQCVGLSEDGCLADILSYKVSLQHREVFRMIFVETYDLVSVPESHFMGKLIYIYLAAFVADVAFAPSSKDSYVYAYGQNEVHHHTSCHHQKPLPCRL